MGDRMHPRDRFRESELTTIEQQWVRDVENSVLERQVREKPHLHEENLKRALGDAESS